MFNDQGKTILWIRSIWQIKNQVSKQTN
jgi:ribulose 1,5-bisphosphate synthetase/thiazole synthase